MNRDRLQTCSLIIAGILLCCFIVAYGLFYKEPIIVYNVQGFEVQSSAIAQEGLININTATIDELMTIDGVGIVTAERIVEYRQQNGGFKFLEELLNIKGIGQAKYDRIRIALYVDRSDE